VEKGSVPLIDAHQHFWHYDAAEYAWIDDGMRAIRRDFLPPDALREMGAVGVTASVAVQVRQTLGETRWFLSLAREHPFIAGVVGWVDLQSPRVGGDLDALLTAPRLVGIRHIVQAEPDGFMARPAFRRGLSALEARGLPFDLLVYARQLGQAIDLVDAHPGQRFLLDHLGKPDIKGHGYDRWRPDFDRLAERPNVWCKVSGLVTEADWRTWTRAALRPYIDRAFEAFGPSRLMLGSDWPVCTVAASYAETMGVVLDALAELSTDEQAAVRAGTARRFWNLVEQPV
jgi:L-fuconolactonase